MLKISAKGFLWCVRVGFYAFGIAMRGAAKKYVYKRINKPS
jgi:hypothetical protein